MQQNRIQVEGPMQPMQGRDGFRQAKSMLWEGTDRSPGSEGQTGRHCGNGNSGEEVAGSRKVLRGVDSGVNGLGLCEGIRQRVD